MTSPIEFPNQMPLVSLKDTVMFPQSIISVYINEPEDQKTVQQAFQDNKLIFVSCLQEPDRDSKRVYRTGCVSFIMRKRVLKDHRIKILIQGLKRASIESVEDRKVFLKLFSENKNRVFPRNGRIFNRNEKLFKRAGKNKRIFFPRVAPGFRFCPRGRAFL